jgi:hypothetical protein
MTIPSQRAIPTCRSPTGTASAMIARPTGNMPPVAAPQTMRAISSTSKLVATAHTADAAMITIRQMIIIRTLPIASATGPRIGCTQAKGRVKAVDSSATCDAATPRLSAIGGMIGSMARVESAVAKPIKLTCVMRREAESELSGGGIRAGSLRIESPQPPQRTYRPKRESCSVSMCRARFTFSD